MKILISWIGENDFVGLAEKGVNGYIGHIAMSLEESNYDKLYLLNNYSEKKFTISDFKKNLKKITSLTPIIHLVDKEIGDNPTDHTKIYNIVNAFVKDIYTKHPTADFTFQTSSGTAAMNIIWLLLSPIYDARIIESSKEKGVKDVLLPQELTACFLSHKRLTNVLENKAPVDAAFKDILHKSAIMQDVINDAIHVASFDIPVLIEGETGTGKELFANAIKNSSKRKDEVFKSINCGAIPSELIESTLFGHARGAFTGADKDTDGLFKQAHGGTLFLDELGEISPKAQIALLRVLQEGKLTKVGAQKEEIVDVRIIAATNRKLIEEVQKGNFREDLFHRLAVARIQLPPLRERGLEDIEFLLEDALKKANNTFSMNKYFSKKVKERLLAHYWYGNARELYNTVTSAVLWSKEIEIKEDTLNKALINTIQKDNILNRPLGNGFSLEKTVAELARNYIEKAEEKTHSKVTKAAELLGFKKYQTYSNWKKKYLKEED